MDKNRAISAVAETPDDEILLAHIYDRLSSGERKNIPAYTGFLTEREQALTARMLQAVGFADFRFFGGCEGAERKVAAWIPDYYDAEEQLMSEEGPITALRASFSSYDKPGHRDFLGGILGLGIRRETIGDLYVAETSCDILALTSIAPYLLDNLFTVGRAHVQVQRIPLQSLLVPAKKTKQIRTTVASLRLDSIVSSGFQMSRTKAQTLITSGRVELNHMAALKPDLPVEEGAVISARGLGKMQLTEISGRTKKDRIGICLERYL